MVETSASNPFAAAMSRAMQAAEEMTRTLTTFKVPGTVGATELMEAHKRNLEAMSAANRIALEGAQTVAKRHMEIVQQTMAELTDNLRVMASVESPTDKAVKQTELLKLAFEHAASNTKELADMIQHANQEAVNLLHKRFGEAMDEVKSLMAPSK
jgi:phasin family protein